MLRPFILDGSDDAFCRAPDDYVNYLNRLAEIWKREKSRIDNRAASGSKPPPAGGEGERSVLPEVAAEVIGSLDANAPHADPGAIPDLEVGPAAPKQEESSN